MLKKNFTNLLGWRTKRRIIVIESDDWGMIRMSSKKAQEDFIAKGYQIGQCPYNTNDSLESDDDVNLLREILLSVKDKYGNPAKFTLNNIVANPDFKKIEEHDFKTYHYESFEDTLNRQSDSKNVIMLIKKGIAENVFQPQLHGREHINTRLWLNRLQENDPKTMDAFKQKMFTVHKSGRINGRRDNLDTFGNSTVTGSNFDYQEHIKAAQQLFYDTWGFKSKSFIAPCYTWHPSVESILKEEGIEFIQGAHVQRIPVDNSSFRIIKKHHFTGQKNKNNQRYLVRNCFFEPTEQGKENLVEKTMKEIKTSFFYKTPAIISSHRVNYIGSLNQENRNENLKLLTELLNSIVTKWPDVEFFSSDQLGDLITKNK